MRSDVGEVGAEFGVVADGNFDNFVRLLRSSVPPRANDPAITATSSWLTANGSKSTSSDVYPGCRLRIRSSFRASQRVKQSEYLVLVSGEMTSPKLPPATNRLPE